MNILTSVLSLGCVSLLGCLFFFGKHKDKQIEKLTEELLESQTQNKIKAEQSRVSSQVTKIVMSSYQNQSDNASVSANIKPKSDLSVDDAIALARRQVEVERKREN